VVWANNLWLTTEDHIYDLLSCAKATTVTVRLNHMEGLYFNKYGGPFL